MSGIVRIHSIESLDELSSDIKRFIWQTKEMLQSIEREINSTMTILRDQINHWRHKEEIYKDEILNASLALERCQDEDDRNCSLEEELLAQAKWHLMQTQIEIEETKKRLTSLEKVEQDYMRQARRLIRIMDDDLQKGGIFLNYLVTKLNKCIEKAT